MQPAPQQIPNSTPAVPIDTTEPPPDLAALRQALKNANSADARDEARDNLASALWTLNQHDECLQHLSEGLATTTNDERRITWARAITQVCVAKGDIDRLAQAYEDLLKLSHNPIERAEVRKQQGSLEASKGNLDAAEARFNEALGEVPRDQKELLESRGQILITKVQTLIGQDEDRVAADLDELDSMAKDATWPISMDFRLNTLLSKERATEALESLNKRLEIEPKLATHAAAHQFLGQIYLSLGDDRWMSEFAKAVSQGSASSDPRALVAAMASACWTQDWKAAIDIYGLLEARDEASAATPDVQLVRGMAHLRIGDNAKAIEVFEHVQPTTPQSRTVLDTYRSEALIRLGRVDEALAVITVVLSAVTKAGSTNEMVVPLQLLTAQALNQRERFAEAEAAATMAIDLNQTANSAYPGAELTLRIGALMQRALSLYKRGDTTKAHADIDLALNEFEQARGGITTQILERTPEFESFEPSLWFAKGAVLDIENRSEEALAAYTRAFRKDKRGAAAALARGHALSATGAFDDAIHAFDIAVRRSTTPREKAGALTGKGRALVRLKKYNEAITTLHAALDARLTEADDDPMLFEMLGIAYNALQRSAAALRAFLRAWELTKDKNNSENLARGITSAQIRLDKPNDALVFFDQMPESLQKDRTLIFNRALALDAKGDRRAAVAELVKAKAAGLDHAQDQLDRLDAPAGLGRWTHHWFGLQASRRRRIVGTIMVVVAATVLAAPLLQWLANGKIDWYWLLLTPVLALVMLVLPSLKTLTIDAGKVKLTAEPLTATGRDAAPVAAPEGFSVPEATNIGISR